MVFILHSIDLVYNAYCFVCVEPSLYPRRESMDNDLFQRLLNSFFSVWLRIFCSVFLRQMVLQFPYNFLI